MVAPLFDRPPKVKQSFLPNGFPSDFDQSDFRTAQKAPFNVVSSYQRQVGKYQQVPDNTHVYLGESGCNAQSLPTQFYNDSLYLEARNKAYANFKDKVYDDAQLGVDFAESRSSLSMIASSCTTLVKAANQIRKLDFLGAAQTFRMKFIPKGVSVRKSFANNWLEYYFGWTPLIGGIFDSIEVLNNPVKQFTKQTGGSHRDLNLDLTTDFGDWKRIRTGGIRFSSFQGGTIRAITDRGLHSLDQFGLLNPAGILWELVPFSFVVDWFANVGQVLSSFSDFAGMEMIGTHTSWKIETFVRGMNVWTASGSPPVPNLTWSGTGVWAGRNPGLTSPVFNISQLKLPSKERALTAVSLLTQILSK
jgi:hypothetical protein